MKKIMVVDDDQAVLNYLNIMLLQTGEFEIHAFASSVKAFQEIQKGKFDLLILDMDMPDITGLDILKMIREKGIETETIVLTGVEDIELAVAAMKWGAFDYLTKPMENEHLLHLIRSALEKQKVGKPFGQEVAASLDRLKFKDAFSDIITQNEEMIRLFHTVEKMATTNNTILIWGESGSGKELIAKAVHRISGRQNENFIAVNAGTFANELFSSEFFGHNKGAFTGAVSSKKGFLEEADRGTLFLDEIGELALPIQVKLLRVLQEGEFFRLGSTKNQKVDVRIIAATNKDLLEEIKKGNFRKDLFYRLNMNSIYLPPLRERRGDIQLLSHHFLKKFCAQNNKHIAGISELAMKLLNQYDFPGNVRELMNLINSAVIVESEPELKKKSLPHYFLESSAFTEVSGDGIPLRSLAEMELEHIKKILQYTRGNKTKAAKILAISRVGLIAKIKKFKIE